MNRFCLALPTNRACAETIRAVHREAADAADAFGAEAHLLVLDSSAPEDLARHHRAVRDLPAAPGVVVHHLDEARQRDFLRRATAAAGLPKPRLALDLLLPAEPSYGACTDRAFLLAAALGCASVHRRDSDSRYQLLDGAPVHPVHHELRVLGRPAAEAAAAATEVRLRPEQADRRVAMAGGSFIGELSVDIAGMEALDPGIYHEVVGLWAPGDWSPERKRELAAESFRGAGTAPFTGDRTLLGSVDPMRVDMCNIAFHGVHEQVPLPPATRTIGSDYFLIHLVHDAGLPGLLHNRHIVNYYTPERRTDRGFADYQLRFTKFLLSMLYFNDIYAGMAAAGPQRLLDAGHRVRASAVADLARRSALLDTAENRDRLDTVERCYRALGGRYARFATGLAGRRSRLLDEARRDIEDFALLTEAWQPLVAAARSTPLPAPARQPAR